MILMWNQCGKYLDTIISNTYTSKFIPPVIKGYAHLDIVSGKYIILSQLSILIYLMSLTLEVGNSFKMQPTRTHTHYNLRKYFFSNRIIAVWNSLPNVVVCAESSNIFKNRLDKFWANQDLKFDWTAKISSK